jgi:flagellar basal-body rod protein FlgB
MFIDGSLTKTTYLLERGLDTSLLRHQVISDNIANVDTPHFKRMDVTFESQMSRALDSEKGPRFPVYTTDKRHIDFFKPMDYREVRAKLQIEHDSNYRNDKNNVDIEKEIGDSVKNTLRYRAMAQRLDGSFKAMNLVLQG